MLKSYGVGGGGLEQFNVSPRPLSFGFGTKGLGAKGLGPGLDNSAHQHPNLSSSGRKCMIYLKQSQMAHPEACCSKKKKL